MITDVFSQAPQMDAIAAQLRDRCDGFITAARDKAKTIIQEAEKRSETMREEIASWEEEKECIARTVTFDPMVNVNVGGHIFSTTLTTLTRYPDTMLGAMFSGRHALVTDESGAYFIDRDGRNFHEVLNFLRAPDAYTTDAMADRMKTELQVEADFYGLKDLMFPAPPAPPFVPATPVVVSTAGRELQMTVTQDGAGLWYMEGTNQRPSFPVYPVNPVSTTRCLVTVCNTCGWGQPSHYPSSTYSRFGVARFTTGRAITDAQPKKTRACNWNGHYCTSD